MSTLVASRCLAGIFPPPANVFAKRGIAYERKVGRTLAALARRNGLVLHSQPWFEYSADGASGCAVPDFILHVPQSGTDIVIEVKLTFKPEAGTKLQDLYLPVVRAANRDIFRTVPLVICKTLILGDWPVVNGICEALAFIDGPAPVLQWLGHGVLAWAA